MNTSISRILVVAALCLGVVGLSGCTDVGVNPKSSSTAENVFQSESSYKAFFAKLYAGLGVTGQKVDPLGLNGGGAPDITVPDNVGFGQYTRLHWNMQELPTESAVTAFSDRGIRDLNNLSWSSQNQFSVGMYNRIYFQVSQVNEFLRQTSDKRLDERGIDEELQKKIQTWRAEARFLRALSLWHGIDFFGEIPVPTTKTTLGDAPEQSSRDSAFAFVERELLEIIDDQGDETLKAAGQAPYGRADKGAAWMLLAKLYQNAPVYLDNPQQQLGENPSNLVIEYTNRIITQGPYSLQTQPSSAFSAYQRLFLADNHKANGLIFTVPQDGQRQRHYGGTQYLTHANMGIGEGELAWSGDPVKLSNSDTGYGGMRTTSDGVALFEADQPTNDPFADDRAIFYTTDQDRLIDGQNPFAQGTIDDPIGFFREGWVVLKFKDLTSSGRSGSSQRFSDIDYPMFRLADAYLMYAEAVLRGGQGGSRSTALNRVNAVRSRANVPTISDSELTLNFLLRERGRELFWEGHRRTDLIRFGEFISGQWRWKGGKENGDVNVDECRKVYPIAASELRANPNLEQNRDCYK